MMNNSQAVYLLQKLHNELVALSNSVTKFKKAIEDDSEVRLSEIKLKAHRGALLKNEQDQKKLDAESEALSAKIREDETRLYNGKVKSPKEMIELQNEISHQKQRMSELEERSFACLTQNETLSEAAAAAEMDLRSTIDTRSADMGQFKHESEASAIKYNQFHAQYLDLRSTLPVDLLAHFDRLLLSKNNIAVALIDEDACGVCGTQLSKQVVLSSRSAETPNTCPTCNRMLFHDH